MKLSLPAGFMESGAHPKPFTRINFSLTPSINHTYKMQTRIIRYEKDKEGNDIMVVTSTNMLSPILKRNAKRIQILDNQPCEFSAVRLKNEGKNQSYEVLEHRYKGILLDVSATGCSIKCSLPIKKGQYIKADFSLGPAGVIETIGTIIVTNRIPGENQYILHINFTEIEKSTQNTIYAYIYNYNPI